MANDFKQLVGSILAAKSERREAAALRKAKAEQMKHDALRLLHAARQSRARQAAVQRAERAHLKSDLVQSQASRSQEVALLMSSFAAERKAMRYTLDELTQHIKTVLSDSRRQRSAAGVERREAFREMMSRVQAKVGALKREVQAFLYASRSSRDGSFLKALSAEVAALSTQTQQMLSAYRNDRTMNAELWHQLVAATSGNAAQAMKRVKPAAPKADATAASKPAAPVKASVNAAFAQPLHEQSDLQEADEAAQANPFSISIPFAKSAATASVNGKSNKPK